MFLVFFKFLITRLVRKPLRAQVFVEKMKLWKSTGWDLELDSSSITHNSQNPPTVKLDLIFIVLHCAVSTGADSNKGNAHYTW